METALASTEPEDFAAVLAASADATQRALDSLLDEETSEISRLLSAMRYAALAPGKRLRPFFVIETARLFGVKPGQALRVGAALECVHCYSLIHDDLPAMDNDDLRRGLPTLHRAFDEATAILAGDALLTLAFEIMADPRTHDDPAIRAALVLELAKAAGKDGMAGGQMRDLEAERQATRDLRSVTAMQAMKTGALFRFACRAGAILGRALREEEVALARYADAVGLAFQIADDILDVESSSDALGKAAGKDSAANKATFVALMGLEDAKSRAAALVSEAKDALALFGPRAAILSAAADFIITRTK
jgi:farnesyl diphosphate synthase